MRLAVGLGEGGVVVEEGSKGVHVGGGVAGAEVGVDGVGVSVPVEVCACEVDEAAFDEVARYLAFRAFVCPGEAQEVDLEHQADVVEMFVPVALAVIVVVSLRVCQYRLITFQLEVEHELFEVQWLSLIHI